MPIRQGALRSVIIRASKKAVERDAKIVVARAKILAPKDTGELAAGITYSIGVGANGLARANIYSKAKHSEAVERGTGIYGPTGMPIRPKTAKFMVFRGRGGGIVRAKTVKGQRAQPFLKPALRSLRRG